MLGIQRFMADFALGSAIGPSLAIWRAMANRQRSSDGIGGVFHYDRFERFQGLTNAISGTTAFPSTTVPSMDGYKAYIDSATSASGITKRTDVEGAIVRFAPGATDNHLAILTTGELGTISQTAPANQPVAMEARFSFPTQVATGSRFVGLSTSGACVDGGLIADAGGLKADQAGIGFRTKEDDADGLDIIFQAASQTPVVVSDVEKVMTAGTFIKAGLLYDPEAPPAKKIKFFIDGEETDVYVTKTQLEAATFPVDVLLGLFAASMTQATTSTLLDLDWWAFWKGAQT